MESMQCFKTNEKGLNQGCYGGNSNANWGWQATKKENKYQERQNGYAMAYSECESYSQARYPTHGMSKSQAAYGRAETWDEYGRSNGCQKPQNGNAMFKPQVHGHGNGYGNLSSNGVQQMQAHGPGKHQGNGYGFGGSAPRNQKISSGMGHGFDDHTNHGPTEANGYGKYSNNGTVHGQAPFHGKHSGQGNGFIKNHQAYGPGKNMGYEITGTETCEYSETYYSNESQYSGGGGGHRGGKGDHPVKGLLRKIKGSISGNKSCSDTESDSDKEDCETKMQKVWISKAI
ncbi:hypothetical protein PTKIN_Ptkin04bG0177400 [Pterospermum kingtungense]